MCQRPLPSTTPGPTPSAASLAVSDAQAEERIPPGLGRPGEGPASLVALDAGGRPIHSKPNNRTPSQGKVRPWEYPTRTPEGACGLSASPLSGLTGAAGRR